MPLDTGVLAEVDLPRAQAPVHRRQRVTLDPNLTVGAGLKAAREGLGLSLEEIGLATKVRVRHLAAIEDNDLDKLPSRPFAIGYVRAYAKELGADADAAAARFRTENPSADDELHNPAGVTRNRGLSRSLLAVGAVALVGIVGWNVLRHSTDDASRKAVAGPAHFAAGPRDHGAAADGPFSVNTPLPAPPEATTPAPYQTPGLPAANAAGGSTQATDLPANVAAPAAAGAPTAFVAQGAIYGPTTGASNLIIQAIKPISLEVRGPGKVVYFARQLAAGEAYRVPALPGLTAEVSNPASAELFEGGVSKGPFPQAQLPLKTTG